VFSFSLASKNLLVSSHFYYDPLAIEQGVVQPPIICMFSADVFVVEF
jgi:hypothetical protein